MSKVIEVNGLSKAYQLGEFTTGSLGEDIKRRIALLRGKEDPFLKIGETNDRTSKGKSSVVWSLKDVSFSIEKGDTVGVIGKNGAGKSTLLKLLSQITSPTYGEIKIRGRVASLLEVGTGFHPELSGRDNIFLNGSILGMRKQEIKNKFDEIVDFAGVERYLDTPVKRYSSGMYVRLAFAVAAHLESEILIVDEVLAVGDADFQKKCLGKMDSISKGEGRTILFVSHNLPMLAALCKKGIVLEKGQLVFNGSASSAMQYYQSGDNMGDGKIIYDGYGKLPGDEFAELLEVRIIKTGDIVTSEIDITESFEVQMRYRIKQLSKNAYPNFHFFDQFGQYVFVTSPSKKQLQEFTEPGEYIAICQIPSNFLNASNFSIGAALTIDHNGARTCFWEQNVLNFTMIEDLDHSPTRIGQYGGAMPGVIRPMLNWNFEKK